MISMTPERMNEIFDNIEEEIEVFRTQEKKLFSKKSMRSLVLGIFSLNIFGETKDVLESSQERRNRLFTNETVAEALQKNI